MLLQINKPKHNNAQNKIHKKPIDPYTQQSLENYLQSIIMVVQ